MMKNVSFITIRKYFHRLEMTNAMRKNKLRDNMNGIKISGTKWYITIEYKGNISRFNGELCINGFCAHGDAMTWLQHKGVADDSERLQLIHDVTEYTKNDKFKVYFIHEDGSEYK